MSKRTRTAGRILRHKRGRKKISGTAQTPRLCVFISNKEVYTQVVDDAAGRTLASASTLEKALIEEAKGKSITDCAKLVGAKIAENAKKAGVEKIVFDKSGYRYGKRVSALADAARKGGLSF